ncbi:uncharacterized protein LOC116170220 [Photinus pyralis]|uniref:uncharacterized protein LOC116170220 n=1 Tax=Photinus pyralis TaxID=7054 RepID=UPI0012670F9B|nr:uncharacterized protein LOC116170220 [Photinus pyralis]
MSGFNFARSQGRNVSLRKGIPPKDKDTLKDVKIPTNLPNLSPPALNPELLVNLSTLHKKRDESYLNLQNSIARALILNGEGLGLLLQENHLLPKKLKDALLSKFWQAGQANVDLFTTVTQTRRSLLVPALARDPVVKDIAETSSADDMLFGKDFGVKVAAARALAKSGKELVAPQTSSLPRVSQPNVGRGPGDPRSLLDIQKTCVAQYVRWGRKMYKEGAIPKLRIKLRDVTGTR